MNQEPLKTNFDGIPEPALLYELDSHTKGSGEPMQLATWDFNELQLKPPLLEGGYVTSVKMHL